jgi:hypothetical protein
MKAAMMVVLACLGLGGCAVDEPRCEEACTKLWGMEEDRCAAVWNFPVQPSTPSVAEDCRTWCVAGLAGEPCPDGSEFCEPDATPQDFEDFLDCTLQHGCDEIFTWSGGFGLEPDVLDACQLGFPDEFGV